MSGQHSLSRDVCKSSPHVQADNGGSIADEFDDDGES